MDFSDVTEFATRLSTAHKAAELLAEPIIVRHAAKLPALIEARAPKRTRRAPGGGMSQTAPGVVELTGKYLVGAVRGTSSRAPSDRFLRDSLDQIERPLISDLGKVGVRAITRR